MGKEIYIERIISSLQSSIAGLSADMAKMSEDMQESVSILTQIMNSTGLTMNQDITEKGSLTAVFSTEFTRDMSGFNVVNLNAQFSKNATGANTGHAGVVLPLSKLHGRKISLNIYLEGTNGYLNSANKYFTEDILTVNDEVLIAADDVPENSPTWTFTKTIDPADYTEDIEIMVNPSFQNNTQTTSGVLCIATITLDDGTSVCMTGSMSSGSAGITITGAGYAQFTFAPSGAAQLISCLMNGTFPDSVVIDLTDSAGNVLIEDVGREFSLLTLTTTSFGIRVFTEDGVNVNAVAVRYY